MQHQVLVPQISKDINYSLIWGKSYQTENCPAKKEAFNKKVDSLYNNAPKELALRVVTKVAADKYTDLGYNAEALSELIYRIALHESNGGQYVKQINGPARSWFQIEVTTAMNLVKKNPELIRGYDANKLSRLSYQAMGDLLEERQDIAATIAIAKIIETGERTGTNKVLKG